MADSDNSLLEILVLTLAVAGLFTNVSSVFYKLVRQFSLPKLWKYSLIAIDFGHVFLGSGLTLFYVYKRSESSLVCDFAGFFLQFGIIDCVCGYLTAGIILFGIYNPGKSAQISKFHRNVFLIIFIPQKIITILLSAVPYLPIKYFSSGTLTYAVTCMRVSQPGENGGVYGILTFCIKWISLFIGIFTCTVSAIKVWKKFNNRIHSSSPNVWQSQLVLQGKAYQKILLIEQSFWTAVLFTLTLFFFLKSGTSSATTWITLITLGAITLIHGGVSYTANVMWSVCCCRSVREVEEPRRKIKKLELIRIEAPGKLRLKAVWEMGKGRARRGLMKVYGPKHVKSWAQEIVVLGMLRKAQHPSLLQCLWTSSSNPYYETMTMITGEIITSDSRIICLEQTSSGTLSELLQHSEVSLPESCQRMIVHDTAEGLFYLHSQNVLHNNLNSSCIYLKGSLPSMVMRAAIGDFEEAQIYGSLQHTTEQTVVSKRQFFLPDIRSFALVALEIVSKTCERRFISMQCEWEFDQDPFIIPNDNAKSPNSPFYHRYSNSYSNPRALKQRSDSMINAYNESDSDDDDGGFRRKPTEGVRSPFELIEEVGRRSRSMSPGSRPLSAQSKRSVRSRTLSPELSRSRASPSVASARTPLHTGRSDTPDPDTVVSGRSMSPVSRGQFGNRTTSSDSLLPLALSPLPDEKKKNKGKKSSKSEGTQAFESTRKQKAVKKTDSKRLLSKPVSIIKNLTGAETTVSTFKPKHRNNDSSAEEISDEEINQRPERFRLSRKMKKDSKSSLHSEGEHSLHRTISQKSDQWSIRSDMEYRPHGLKNTISADSRSSMWSNLPLPLDNIDVERDDLEEIIDCLPGMTNSFPDKQNMPSVREMLNARERMAKAKLYWQQDGPGPQRFELVDYYDELQGRYVKKLQPIKSVHRTSSGTQIVGAPAHRTFSGTQVLLHRTSSGLHEIIETKEVTDDDEEERVRTQNTAPQLDNKNENPKKIKPVLLKDENVTAEKTGKENRPKTSKKKKSVKGYPAPQPPLTEQDKEENEQKRSKARTALKRALSNKGGKVPVIPLQRSSSRSENLDIKYANVKRLLVKSKEELESQVDLSYSMEYEGDDNVQEPPNSTSTPKESDRQQEGVHYKKALQKETGERKNPYEKLSRSGVKRFSSFSSNDSCSSIGSSVRVRKADVSLTSGELTSLSSQADPDTDHDFSTDVDMSAKEAYLKRVMQTRRKNVDSGFDSESSEMSSDVQVHNSFHSDDSAFHESRNKAIIAKKLERLKRSGPLSTINISSTTHFSEKAFCVTGINSGISNESVIQTDSREPQTEYSPANDVIVAYSADDIRTVEEARPMSSLSRIIEVSCASPDHTKDIDFDEEMEKLTPILNAIGSKDPPNRPKTPSALSRTKSPPPPSLRPKTPLEMTRPKTALAISRPITPSAMPRTNPPAKPRPKMPATMSRPKTPSPLSDDPKGPNVMASNPTDASRRYRELVKKGVPLRVSEISADDERREKKSAVEINEKEDAEDNAEDQNLFDDLESRGFFHTENHTPKLSPGKTINTSNRKSRRDQARRDKRHKAKMSKLSLDEIIREIPEDTSPSPSHKSPMPRSPSNQRSNSDNPLFNQQDSEIAMINQPHTSEDSETASVQNSSVANSVPPTVMPQSQPAVVVDAELYIDRIYSQTQSQPQNVPMGNHTQLLDPDFDSPFLAENSKLIPPPVGDNPNRRSPFEDQREEDVEMDIDVPLLVGMSDKHVDKCRKITSCLQLISFNDLIPATKEGFDMMTLKLQQGGQLGIIGNQILDIIQRCWLSETPPTSFDLVMQLMDPVTETEL